MAPQLMGTNGRRAARRSLMRSRHMWRASLVRRVACSRNACLVFMEDLGLPLFLIGTMWEDGRGPWPRERTSYREEKQEWSLSIRWHTHDTTSITIFRSRHMKTMLKKVLSSLSEVRLHRGKSRRQRQKRDNHLPMCLKGFQNMSPLTPTKCMP